MAPLELAAAATGARVISARSVEPNAVLSALSGKDLHYFRRSPAALQKSSHDLHGPVYMFEESLVPGTEVIQPRLAIWSADEPVLRALAVTGEPHSASAAI